MKLVPKVGDWLVDRRVTLANIDHRDFQLIWIGTICIRYGVARLAGGTGVRMAVILTCRAIDVTTIAV